MSDAKPDLKEIATKRRDHLMSELAGIDAFIEMADHLSTKGAEEACGLDPSAEKDEALELH